MLETSKPSIPPPIPPLEAQPAAELELDGSLRLSAMEKLLEKGHQYSCPS